MKMYETFKGYGIFRKGEYKPTLCEYSEELRVMEKAKRLYDSVDIPVKIYPIEISRGSREIK